MNVRLIVLFSVLLLLPLGLSFWLGIRSFEDAQSSALTQARGVWSGRLNDLRSLAANLAQTVEERLRRSQGDDALILTRFRWEGGVLVEPPRYRSDGSTDPFWTRTATLWDRKFWARGAQEGEGAPSAGWVNWNTAEGPGYVYWWREGDVIRGAEVDPWGFLSRLSAQLPDLKWTGAEAENQSLVLRDAAGHVFQRWGRWEAGTAAPVMTLEFPTPWDGWELRLYLSGQALGQNGLQWIIVFCLMGLGLAGVVAVGGWVLVRSVGSRLREAGQRVRFVNQVSHELKTPLTNILLYGELLEGSLTSHLSPQSAEYLQVIRDESNRLGRLITNVLTFARRDKRDEPRRRVHEWNALVESSLKPLLAGAAQRGIELKWLPGPTAQGEWDPDWVGQVLGNLVSNAEKYAASGRVVTVEAGTSGASVWVRVFDRGPGIPPSERERIFVPFARLDDRLTSGAAGAGLGLGIARDLARRHGGDLILEPRSQGASFCLTLPVRGIDS